MQTRDGDAVATIAWNTHGHLELYYDVSGMGAGVHTVNPRSGPWRPPSRGWLWASMNPGGGIEWRLSLIEHPLEPWDGEAVTCGLAEWGLA